MSNPLKKVAAIHDLSGFGRASLTTIIPILSTMKIQVCPFPTAILSTHTGGFENYSFVDLTDSMKGYMKHWQELGIDFDCIYSGFLGSTKQIDIVSDFLDIFGTKDNLIVIDPVMGDDGTLYDTIDKVMVKKMRQLIQKSDIITPNFTEAAYLLDKPYCSNISINKIKKWLIQLSDMGPNIVIITSVPDYEFNKNMSVVAYDKIHDKFWKISCEYIPVSFPGTGDAFTSVLIGSLLQGDDLPIALNRSVQFINTSIRVSCNFQYPIREGILLEKVLENLNNPLMSNNCQSLSD